MRAAVIQGISTSVKRKEREEGLGRQELSTAPEGLSKLKNVIQK